MKVAIFSSDEWATAAAGQIVAALPPAGSVVLTGGSSAAELYPVLARQGADWSRIQVFFSDERCVPPNHPESNYRMARELLLDEARPQSVHRMRGEDDPDGAAAAYDEEIAPVAEAGIDLLLLGIGADCHVGALFPNSPALNVRSLCAAVDRPDGLKGLTLTPPVMTGAQKVLLLVRGDSKAEAVARVVNSEESIASCPAALLRDHPDATFLLDEASAAHLSHPPPS